MIEEYHNNSVKDIKKKRKLIEHRQFIESTGDNQLNQPLSSPNNSEDSHGYTSVETSDYYLSSTEKIRSTSNDTEGFPLREDEQDVARLLSQLSNQFSEPSTVIFKNNYQFI